MPNKVVQIGTSDPAIIAPCGINCSLCRAYIREHHPCPGCRGADNNKSNACLTCAIRNCKELATGSFQFCAFCGNFPCADVQHLEKRYKTKYSVSIIANLERIKTVGAGRFVHEESSKWACPECGSLLCVHKSQCPICGYEWQGK